MVHSRVTPCERESVHLKKFEQKKASFSLCVFSKDIIDETASKAASTFPVKEADLIDKCKVRLRENEKSSDSKVKTEKENQRLKECVK